MKNRIKLQLIVLCVLFLVPAAGLAEYRQFAVVSDTHVGAPNSQYGTFLREVEAEGITMVVHTGDAVNTPGNEAQWAEFQRLGAGQKLFLTPGNHDVRDQRSLETYLSAFRDPYYSYSDADTLFVFLNTEMPGHRRRIDGEQLSWLRAELDRPFRYKFVFLHEPLYPFLPYNGLDRHRRARNGLHLLFARKGVSLVVAGHDHVYGRMVKDGVEYVIMPAAGGRIPWFMEKTENYGYMLVTRTGDRYSFEVRDLSGRIKDEFALDRSPSRVLVRNVPWPGLLRNRLDRLLAAAFPGLHPFAMNAAKPRGV